MQKITSRDNQKIKHAGKVRDGKLPHLIFVEGARLAVEVLRSDLAIEDVFITESFAASKQNQTILQNLPSNKIIEVAEKVFASLADTKNPQGIIIIAEKPATDKTSIEKNLRTKKQLLVVMLHETNNPANLGAILRTAEAADAAGIIVTANSCDAFAPKAVRGAMGANFRLPLWTHAGFDEVIAWARANNLKTVCADVNAAQSYLEIDWTQPRLLIFGSEAHGLSEAERSQIDESLLIPMANDVESLNLAISCGIILFEARRHQD